MPCLVTYRVLKGAPAPPSDLLCTHLQTVRHLLALEQCSGGALAQCDQPSGFSLLLPESQAALQRIHSVWVQVEEGFGRSDQMWGHFAWSICKWDPESPERSAKSIDGIEQNLPSRPSQSILCDLATYTSLPESERQFFSALRPLSGAVQSSDQERVFLAYRRRSYKGQLLSASLVSDWRDISGSTLAPNRIIIPLIQECKLESGSKVLGAFERKKACERTTLPESVVEHEGNRPRIVGDPVVRSMAGITFLVLPASLTSWSLKSVPQARQDVNYAPDHEAKQEVESTWQSMESLTLSGTTVGHNLNLTDTFLNPANRILLAQEVILVARDPRTDTRVAFLRKRGRYQSANIDTWHSTFSGHIRDEEICGNPQEAESKGLLHPDLSPQVDVPGWMRRELKRELAIEGLCQDSLQVLGIHSNPPSGSLDLLGIWNTGMTIRQLFKERVETIPGPLEPFDKGLLAHVDETYACGDIVMYVPLTYEGINALFDRHLVCPRPEDGLLLGEAALLLLMARDIYCPCPPSSTSAPAPSPQLQEQPVEIKVPTAATTPEGPPTVQMSTQTPLSSPTDTGSGRTIMLIVNISSKGRIARIVVDGKPLEIQSPQLCSLLVELVREPQVDCITGFLAFREWAQMPKTPERCMESARCKLNNYIAPLGWIVESRPESWPHFLRGFRIDHPSWTVKKWVLCVRDATLAGPIVEARVARRKAEEAFKSGDYTRALSVSASAFAGDRYSLTGALLLLDAHAICPGHSCDQTLLAAAMDVVQSKCSLVSRAVESENAAANPSIRDMLMELRRGMEQRLGRDLRPSDPTQHAESGQLAILLNNARQSSEDSEYFALFDHHFFRDIITRVVAALTPIFPRLGPEDLRGNVVTHIYEGVKLKEIAAEPLGSDLQRTANDIVSVLRRRVVETLAADWLGSAQTQGRIRKMLAVQAQARKTKPDVADDEILCNLGRAWTKEELSQYRAVVGQARSSTEFNFDEYWKVFSL